MSTRTCKGSWIDVYLDYTAKQESPVAFHEWTAMSIIGATLGRHVSIPRIKYTIYPNLYVVLVAASAKCRKSSAIQTGRHILESIVKPPMIFAQKITVEALIGALKESTEDNSSSGIIISSELSVFMGGEAMKSGVLPALTDLYDSPKYWVYHTKARGKEELTNVTLSMLAATTKDGIQDCLPKGAVGGGFTSRVIFVYQELPSNLRLFNDLDENGNEVTESKYERGLRLQLVQDLEHMRTKVNGQVKFTAGAKAFAEEWYREENAKIKDEKLDGYFGRKHDTMFKVATIISASSSDNLIVTEKHIQQALDKLKENEINMGIIISSVLASELGNDIQRILDIIKANVKISYTDIVHKSWRFASAVEVSTLINTLLSAREIKEEISGNNIRYYSINQRR